MDILRLLRRIMFALIRCSPRDLILLFAKRNTNRYVLKIIVKRARSFRKRYRDFRVLTVCCERSL